MKNHTINLFRILNISSKQESEIIYKVLNEQLIGF